MLLPRQGRIWQGVPKTRSTPCPRTSTALGIDIGKNSFHVVGLDNRGAIVLRQKWTRGQIEARLANMPRCVVGIEACVGAHHLSRKLQALGHDARLIPAKYVRPYSKGQKNDFRDAEAIAEAVQRPTMKFVATKTAEQLDLQARGTAYTDPPKGRAARLLQRKSGLRGKKMKNLHDLTRADRRSAVHVRASLFASLPTLR